jgi:hypothetical protein
LITGALLGCVCIIGAGIRAGGVAGNEIYLIALWYNRVIMGLTIGLAGNVQITGKSYKKYIRSGIFGLLVSAAFFISTDFKDYVAFGAGFFYGLIIEYVASKDSLAQPAYSPK